MRLRFAFVLPALLWASAAAAQLPPPPDGAGAPPGGAFPPGGPGGAPGGPMMGPGGPGMAGGITNSAAVQADGRITFSLYAPDAQTVKLSGEYPVIPGGGFGPHPERALPMTKDSKGVWSITVGPFRQDLLKYGFVVDGLAINDPSASFTLNGKSAVFVHGAATANFEMAHVPHGTVSEVWYESKAYHGARRRLIVYTPPGYDASTQRYPVLYLLHGGGGNETSWSQDGRAPEIFDNLIAKGKMVPAIVVMPNGGNGGSSFAEKDATLPEDQRGRGGPPSGPAPGAENSRVQFLTSLTGEIIPFVDKTYRTRADRDHRAVAGQSGGGGESIIIGMNRLDTFSWIGAFSPGWPDVPDNFWVSIPKPADADSRRGPEVGRSINPDVFKSLVPVDGAAANKALHLFYFGVGDADGLVETETAIRKVFDGGDVHYEWVEKHDYGHDFDLWRINLEEFASKVFQAK